MITVTVHALIADRRGETVTERTSMSPGGSVTLCAVSVFGEGEILRNGAVGVLDLCVGLGPAMGMTDGMKRSQRNRHWSRTTWFPASSAPCTNAHRSSHGAGAGVRTCGASRPQGGMCDEVRNDYQRLTESGGMCGRVSVFFVLVFLFAEPGTCCVECRSDIETGSGHARIGWDGRKWVRRLSVDIRCQNDDSLCVTSVPCTSERPQDEKR